MADVTALQDACVAAEEKKSALLAFRQTQRETLSRQAFIDYNAETRAEQLAVQAAVDAADKAFTEALDEVRVGAVHQVVDVGTLEEGNQARGVSS